MALNRDTSLVSHLPQFAAGIEDLGRAWKRREFGLYLAYSETVARYRRSFLGPFWLVISTCVSVVGLGFVWSTLLHIDPHQFIPSLTLGLITWQMIAGSFSESAGVFTRAASSILNIRTPSFQISMQLLFRQLINFGHNLLVILVVFVIYPQPLHPYMLLVIPGFIVVAISILGMIQSIGYFGARYRDLEPLIVSFVPVLFFLSPVIYQSRQLGEAEFIMEFNPLAQWIRLIRDPILGHPPSLANYATALVTMVLFWIVALWVTSAKGHRLPYWV